MGTNSRDEKCHEDDMISSGIVEKREKYGRRMMTDHERLCMISAVYSAVLNNTNTFHGTVGGDCAYLLAAIADKIVDKNCEFSQRSQIVKILRDNFDLSHKVWSFIDLT